MHYSAAITLIVVWFCHAGLSFAEEPLPLIAAEYVTSWGKQGDAPGDFYIPIGIAIDAAGAVYVSDHYNNRIQKFDSDGKLLAHFPVLPNPGGVTIAGDELFISHFPAARVSKEKTPDRVTVYSLEGKLLRQWGSTGSGDGQMDFPGGLAAGKAGEVYLADQTNRRVQVFDSQGRFLRKWGEYGLNPGQFGGNVAPKSRVGGPQFVAIDSEGNVFTTEASVGRVQKFTADGKLLLAWGSLDDKPGCFGGKLAAMKANLIGPIGICVDARDRLWITAVSGRVQCFTRDGRYLGGLGDQQGEATGQFSAPHGIAVNNQQELFVADTYNNRVQKFRITLK